MNSFTRSRVPQEANIINLNGRDSILSIEEMGNKLYITVINFVLIPGVEFEERENLLFLESEKLRLREQYGTPL